jgi:RNA polymerase subunit RPABC4/transcription elongation factor Spt4
MNLRNDSTESLCIKCGRPLNESWSYCPYCTTEVNTIECSCGRHLQANWKFCPYCKEQVIIANSIEISKEEREDSNEWLSKILSKK